MESQKDRFIRQYMEIRDDRKDRGFDRQSIERRQRIMPQGQKDLGIYPGANAPTGAIGTLNPYGQEPEFAEFVSNFHRITQDQNNIDFGDSRLYIMAPSLTLNNCKIFASSGDDTGNTAISMDEANVFLYSATFNNCTFTMFADMKNSTFNNCDFVQSGTFIAAYLMSALQNDKLMVKDQYQYFFFTNRNNTYNNCTMLDLDAYLDGLPAAPLAPYGIQAPTTEHVDPDSFLTGREGADIPVTDVPLTLISENLSGKNFRNFIPVIAEPNLTISNSEFEQFYAWEIIPMTLDENHVNFQAYVATFDHCTFYWLDQAFPSYLGSTFNNCDMTPLETAFVSYYRDSGEEGAERVNIKNMFDAYVRPESCTFNNCKQINFDDVWPA